MPAISQKVRTPPEEKTYYIVHIVFGKQNRNHYTVYSYRKTRRFTANQAWQHIRQGQLSVIASDNLPAHATIYSHFSILAALNVPAKMADRYCTFGFVSK